MKIPRCIRITAFVTCAIFTFTTVAQSAPSHYFAPQPRAQVLADIIQRGGDPAQLDDEMLARQSARPLATLTATETRALYDENVVGTDQRAVLGTDHMRRVSQMADTLGRHLGLNPRLLGPLKNVARVHDLNDLGRFTQEERAQLRERSRAIMRRYVAVPKDPRRSRVIDFLCRQTALGPEYFTEDLYQKAVNLMLQREKIVGDERSRLRDMMMVEANHEQYALEVLRRKHIHLSRLEEWLLLRHKDYIDFEDAADRKELADLALYYAVEVDELVLTLDIFVLTDVFENFINRRRLIEYRDMEPLTLKEGMDRVSYKIKWMKSIFGKKVQQAMIDLLYDHAGRTPNKSNFYQAAAEARGVDDFTINEIEELFAAYYGSEEDRQKDTATERVYYEATADDHPMLHAKRIRVAHSSEDIAFLEAYQARALLLSDGKYLVRKEVAADPVRLVRAVVHEDVEALMQIMQKDVGAERRVLPFDPGRYQQIREKVLETPGLFAWYTEHVLEDNRNDLPTDLIINDIIARTFETLCARDEIDGGTETLDSTDTTLLMTIEPLIDSHRHTLFTSEFFDWHARRKVLEAAFSAGIVFRASAQFPWSGQSAHTYIKSVLTDTSKDSFTFDIDYADASMSAAESQRMRAEQIEHIRVLAEEKDDAALTEYLGNTYRKPVREAARAALEKLGALSTEHALEFYKEEIFGPYSRDVREKAIHGLPSLGDIVIPELERLLRHDIDYMREAATEALKEMGAYSDHHRLIRYRRDILSGEFVAEDTMFDELAALGAKAVSEWELMLLMKEYAASAVRVVDILGEVGRTLVPGRDRDRIISVLELALDHASGDVRDAAEKTLRAMGAFTLRGRLIRYKKDAFSTDREKSQKAFYELADLGSVALPLFDDMLRNGRQEVRRMAAEALGRIADPRMVPALVLSLNDAPDVRFAAGKALKKTSRTNPGAVSFLDSLAFFMLSSPVVKATVFAGLVSGVLFALTQQSLSLAALLAFIPSFSGAAVSLMLPLAGILAIEYGAYGLAAHALYAYEKAKAQRMRNLVALEAKRIVRQDLTERYVTTIGAGEDMPVSFDAANSQIAQIRAHMEQEKRTALLALETAISKDDRVRVRMFLESPYAEVSDAAATALSISPITTAELLTAVHEAEKTDDRKKLHYLRADTDPDVRQAAGESILRLMRKEQSKGIADSGNQNGSASVAVMAGIAGSALIFSHGSAPIAWVVLGGVAIGTMIVQRIQSAAPALTRGTESEEHARNKKAEADAQIFYINELARSRDIAELGAHIDDIRDTFAQGAIMALIEIGINGSGDERRRVIELFERALKHGHPDVRGSAISALGQIAQSVSASEDAALWVIDICENELRRGDTEARFRVIKTLAEISAKVGDTARGRILTILEEILGDWKSSVRAAAGEALGVAGKIGPAGTRAEIFTTLKDALSNGDPYKRRGALLGLGEIGTVASASTQQSIITILERSFSAGGYDERRIAARSLANMGSALSGRAHERIIAIFEHALGAGDFDLRIVATSALSHMGTHAREKERSRVFIAMNKALKNESSYLRALAVTELASWNDPRAIAALIVRLKDEEPVRMAAIKGLRALHERNPGAFSFDDKLAMLLLTNHFLKATGLYAAIGLLFLTVLISQPAALMVLPFFAALAGSPLASTVAVAALAAPVYSLYALIAYLQYRYHDTGAALTIDEIKAEQRVMSDESQKHIPFDDSIAFAIIKPDGYFRRGEILEALQAAGFEIVLQKESRLPVPAAKAFYAEHKGRLHFPRLIAYMTSGPVMQLVLRRHGDRPAWQVLREKVGATSGQETGTLRNLFGTEKITHKDGTVTIKNKIHCSDSLESVAREIGFIDGVALESEPRTHTRTLLIGNRSTQSGSARVWLLAFLAAGSMGAPLLFASDGAFLGAGGLVWVFAGGILFGAAFIRHMLDAKHTGRIEGISSTSPTEDHTRVYYEPSATDHPLLRERRILIAVSKADTAFLEAHQARAILLSDGKYLVRKEVADDPQRLLRAVVHEDIEALMQIMQKDVGADRRVLPFDPGRYQQIREKLLETPGLFGWYTENVLKGNRNELPTDLVVNDIIARTVEALFARDEIDGGTATLDLTDETLLLTIEPLINAHRHTLFRSEFFDWHERGKVLKEAFDDGVFFYTVFGRGSKCSLYELGACNDCPWCESGLNSSKPQSEAEYDAREEEREREEREKEREREREREREISGHFATIKTLFAAKDIYEIKKYFRSDYSDIRRAAAKALGAIGENAEGPERTRIVSMLEKVLEDRDEDVRRAAAEALGAIGENAEGPERTRIVSMLEKVLEDRDEDVRRAAAEALGKIGDPRVIPALIVRLKDEKDTAVRTVVRKALDEIKANDPEAFSFADRLSIFLFSQPLIKIIGISAAIIVLPVTVLMLRSAPLMNPSFFEMLSHSLIYVAVAGGLICGTVTLFKILPAVLLKHYEKNKAVKIRKQIKAELHEVKSGEERGESAQGREESDKTLDAIEKLREKGDLAELNEYFEHPDVAVREAALAAKHAIVDEKLLIDPLLQKIVHARAAWDETALKGFLRSEYPETKEAAQRALDELIAAREKALKEIDASKAKGDIAGVRDQGSSPVAGVSKRAQEVLTQMQGEAQAALIVIEEAKKQNDLERIRLYLQSPYQHVRDAADSAYTVMDAEIKRFFANIAAFEKNGNIAAVRSECDNRYPTVAKRAAEALARMNAEITTAKKEIEALKQAWKKSDLAAYTKSQHADVRAYAQAAIDELDTALAKIKTRIRKLLRAFDLAGLHGFSAHASRDVRDFLTQALRSEHDELLNCLRVGRFSTAEKAAFAEKLGRIGSSQRTVPALKRILNMNTDVVFDLALSKAIVTILNREAKKKESVDHASQNIASGNQSGSARLRILAAIAGGAVVVLAALPFVGWAADPALEVMRQYDLSVEALQAVRDMYWSEWSPVLYGSLFLSAVSGVVAVIVVLYFRGSPEERHKKFIVQKVKENYSDIHEGFPARVSAAADDIVNHALRLYTHHSPYVRAYSVYQLADLEHPDAELVMKRLLLNETADDPLRALLYGIENAALDRMHQALRTIIQNQVNHDPATIEAELTSDQAKVRGFAANSLASLRAYASLPALQAALLVEEDEVSARKIERAIEVIGATRPDGNTNTSAGIVKMIIPACVMGVLLRASNAVASDFFSAANEWVKTNDMKTAFFALSSLALMYVSGHIVFKNVFPRLLMRYKDKLVAQGSASSYVRYGAVSHFFGRTDEALAAAEKARAVNPYWSDSYKMLGELYEAKGDYEKALTHYGRALEFPKWSSHIRTRLNYIDMLEKTGKIDEARQAFDSLLRSMPDSIDVISALSAFLARHEANITEDRELRAELARQKSRSAFVSLKTHSTSLVHMIASNEKDNGIDYKGILVAAGVFSVWLAVMGITLITVISGALVASIASSLARRLGMTATPGAEQKKHSAAVRAGHTDDAVDRSLRSEKAHAPLTMAAADEKESRSSTHDPKERPVVVTQVERPGAREVKNMPMDASSDQTMVVPALSSAEEQALSFAEHELRRLFKREFRDEVKKQLSLSVRPGIQDLARYAYDESASRSISITFSRAALGDQLVAAAEGVHEYIYHFFERQFVGSTLGLMHVQDGREIPFEGHTVVYARELKDLVATVIKLRYLITAAFDMDSARSIELEREIAPGTAYAELLRFLGHTDETLSDVSKMRLKHMLNRFHNTWGTSLETQIAAVQEILSLKPSAAESGSALTSGDIKNMADFIRDVETRLFEYGTFDERLEQIAERILKKDGRDLASFGTAVSEKRAVIIDSTEIGALDAGLIGSLLGEDRALFAVSEDELYEVHVQNGRIITGGSLLRVSGLDEAASALEAQSFTVSVVSGAENARERFGERLMRRDSVLLFSTEHARKELGQNVPELFALETFVLPYAFHMQREQLITQSGSGRVFHQAGRIFSLNPGYIARFGDTLEASFSRIMDSIKIAVAEIHARRAIDIAA